MGAGAERRNNSGMVRGLDSGSFGEGGEALDLGGEAFGFFFFENGIWKGDIEAELILEQVVPHAINQDSKY